MNKREIVIKNFRNIGIVKEEKLLLNTSAEKNKMGELVILIGPNNSGKSNVLDSLSSLGNGIRSDRDVTSLRFEEEYKNPKVSIEIENDEKNKVSFWSSLNGWGLSEINKNRESEIADEIKKLIKNKNSILSKFPKLEHELINLFNKDENDFLNVLKNIFFDQSNNSLWVIDSHKSLINAERENFREYIKKNYSLLYHKQKSLDANELNEILHKKWNINFLPNIFVYKDKQITQSDLNRNLNQLQLNVFFDALFKKINIENKTISNVYEQFKKEKVRGFLTKLEREINDKLKEVSKDFNKLYTFSKEKYSFEINCDENKISLSIFMNNTPINLDNQSVGFKWFFNFYFNLLSGNELKEGDIILIDEPGVHLHVGGQKEFRNFLKNFTIKNNLTTVITTHSPFLIDLDYLDEIRVISTNPKTNEVIINNKFHTIDKDDSDLLFNIKNALTIENNVLFNEDNVVVFVEGVTDYNYLTAFKKLFNKEEKNKFSNLIFLPINGLGKTKEEMIETSKKIIKIRKNKPIILIDNDKSGEEFRKLNSKEKSSINVISLGDIDNSFRAIESVFENSDKDKLNINYIKDKENIDKSFEASSNFKNHIEKYEISEATKKNFRKILNNLKEVIE